MNSFLRRFALPMLLGLLLSTTAAAQGVFKHDDLSIRYNALPATALPLQSATDLGVRHDANQGLLNVLITRGPSADATGITADVSARATSENGSAVKIHVRAIKDANGVSYLGTFRIPQTGVLRFDVDVTAPGAATQHVHFNHTFVVD